MCSRSVSAAAAAAEHCLAALLEPGNTRSDRRVGTAVSSFLLRPGRRHPSRSGALDCDPSGSAAWEDGARRFIERDLLPLGLATLECFARAPYLSAGDSEAPLYELDGVVVVLSKR